MPNIRSFQGIQPTLGKRIYLDELSCVIGRVSIGDDCSTWPGVIIRGDVSDIEICERTNIQDGSIVHVGKPSHNTPDGFSLYIGNNVTIGHQVMLHGCTIKIGY